MDVRSLYTNIPNGEGIEAIKGFFRARSKPGDSTLSKVIQAFLTLILTLNNFVFNDNNYVQVDVRSMGNNVTHLTQASSSDGLKIYTSYTKSGNTYRYMSDK